MMARNLKVFIKIYAEVKRKSKRELENFTEALVLDQKMAELEKQNLENRIFLLGAKKPNQFFNTHPRAYEKVPINVTNQMHANLTTQQAQGKLQDNSANNPNLTNNGGNGGDGGAKTHKVQNSKGQNLNNNFAYTSISSMDNNNDPSHRSLMEPNQIQNSNSKTKGQNKAGGAKNMPAPSGQPTNNSYGRKK